MNLKKPKFWDLKEPSTYAYLLLPISLLIRLLTNLKKIKLKKKTKIKTICIGNIYLGGTGKTSLTIKIKKILTEKNFKCCFVKKFYKNQIDEQEILEKNGKLYLSKKRLNAIKEAENDNYQIVILDDGLQDYSIEYDVSFVCFNNINWIGNGLTIPSGPLREPLSKLKNYKNIFINGNLENIESLKKQIININPKINIHIGVYEVINLNEFDINEKYIVFSGIGNHKTFINMLKKFRFNILKDFEFPDHYKYKNNDINKIIEKADNLGCKIITTEKDFFRLNGYKMNKIKFIKSELKIVDEEKLINSII